MKRAFDIQTDISGHRIFRVAPTAFKIALICVRNVTRKVFALVNACVFCLVRRQFIESFLVEIIVRYDHNVVEKFIVPAGNVTINDICFGTFVFSRADYPRVPVAYPAVIPRIRLTVKRKTRFVNAVRVFDG